MLCDWKLEISKLVNVKQEIAAADTENIWPHHLPGVAATSSDLVNLEQKLGRNIPAQYVEFLRFANGWRGFYQSVDLFGIESLLDKELKTYTNHILDQVSIQNDKKEDLLTIAATQHDIDIFCLNLDNEQVIWYAGTEVDRFENFNEYYLAMVDYNRKELSVLKSESS